MDAFAGKPAPAGDWCAPAFHHSTGRALARLQLLILTHRPVVRPSGGSAQWATRHGCRVSRPRPWMADGGGPTEQDRSEGMPSLGEAPDVRGQAFWLLWRSSKVTRCKSGTIRSRYRSNGYVHNQKSASFYCVSRYTLHKIFTKPPRQFAPRRAYRAVINGNAADDRATFAHRARPGAENWPTEGKAPLFF